MKLPSAWKLVLLFASWASLSVANSVYTEEQISGFMADMWVEGADVLKILWRDCSKKLLEAKEVTDMKEYFPKFVKCMKKKTLKALDRSLNTDIVPIADGVNLVRYELVDRQGKIMHNSENDTNISTWTEQEMESGSWRMLALERMARVLRTHVIKLDFSGEGLNTPEKAEFRHRRRHQMMTMMMFGIISMGMVLVPMGFQFLAVLGGKALLLAKMALILSSIQGLKKVDDVSRYPIHRAKGGVSPVNYGFYHSYPPPYEHFDKRAYDTDWPEPNSLPAKVPPPLASYDPWPNDDQHPGMKADRSMHAEARTWTPELPKPMKRNDSTREAKVYPVYPSETSTDVPVSSFFGALLTPSSLAETDPTTTVTPNEVHAEYSIDLPVNRIRFQSPTTLVSA